MDETHRSEDDEVRRERLRSEVIMPDQLEDYEWKVDGTREYRRNAIVLILCGLFILFFCLFSLFLSGRFQIGVAILGSIVIGMGVARLVESKRD